MGLFKNAAEAAREAFKLKQARAIDLFGDGDEVYHWVAAEHLPNKVARGFSPFTHVGTKKAAEELFDIREGRYDKTNHMGATLPLRFNRKKDILDVEKDIGAHSALGVMWQVAPYLYGNRESAIGSPLVQRTLDSVVRSMTDREVNAIANEIIQEGYVPYNGTDMSQWLRKALESMPDTFEETQSGIMVKNRSRDADMIGRQTLANELEKFNIGALQYTNNVEDVGSKSYMIVQPHDIRSRFANYDPGEWRRRSKNIMAAVPALAGGGGLLAMSKREREAA